MKQARALAFVTVFAAAAVVALAGCAGGSAVSSAIDSINPVNWGASPAPQMAPLPELTSPIAVKTLWQANIGNSQQSIFHAKSIKTSPAVRWLPSSAPIFARVTRSRTNFTPRFSHGWSAARRSSKSMMVIARHGTPSSLTRMGSVHCATAP